MSSQEYSVLTQADVDHFMQYGWLKLSNCFSRETAASKTSTLWTRLGMDPSDKSTWNLERPHMPKHNLFQASEFAPKAWGAICDLLGGEANIGDDKRTWNDGFIVNMGTKEGAGKEIPPQKLQGWHVDGDFFVHFLDSPEQALLVIPLFTDIRAGGGGTFLCPPAIPHVAKHLYKNTDGVSPRMVPMAQNPPLGNEQGLYWFNDLAASFPPEAFVEATGVVGDVYLLHPLMLHSASNNMHRDLRIITNPPVSLKEPFNFDRENPGEYNLVEKKTLQALGKDRLEGWRITGPRQKVIPERWKKQEEMKKQELTRLAALKEKADSNGTAQNGINNVAVAAN